jgi:2-hydroxy-3-keto-5-methylthiopentenyl-1-phosphate phosphatase
MLILCDFDNTVTTRDVTHVLLDDFTDGKWREVQRQYEQREITHFEVMRRSYEYLRTPEATLVKHALEQIPIRPHFAELVSFCQQEQVELVVVSGGLDFYIKALLPDQVPVHSYLSEFGEFWKVSLPADITVGEGEDFKVKVLHKVLQSTSSPVHPFIFIGDGSNDQAAAREADYVFAVKDSLLAKARRRENLPTREFTDFAEVLVFVRDLLVPQQANS